ncbi:MAG: enoyl-CoA hydratase-related protein [Streptosporangiales bacterium]|nr:enoyl-CoA hydratase-related protein [Streptosporangiales bacterium]
MSNRIRTEDASPGVRLITFDRPEARNAFDLAMYAEAAAAFGEAAADDSVRVIVMTGAGAAFTAGQDLRELAALARASDGDGARDMAALGFPALLNAVTALDKPLIAAVNGAAVGLGFTLLAHADLVYVAESARLRVPFAEYGVPPEAASSYLLPQRLGWQRAAQVLFTGDWVSAADAVEWDIALRACPDDELLGVALTEAARIARASLPALRGIKRLMQAWQHPHVDAALSAEADAYTAQLGTTTTIPAPKGSR